MSNYNKTILLGNLTKDPDLSYTPSGKAVCKFTLAINSSHKNKAGEKIENADFIPVTVWDKQAETVAEWLSKGKSALVEGRIKQERWTTKENENRSRLVVIANAVRFIGSKSDSKSIKEELPADEANAQDDKPDNAETRQKDNTPDYTPAEDGTVPF